mmetsp:Transcript_20363/g.55955  ORF Transcript_20363/g.55955 Transcript_20363/m.55955 type:complete len:90 (+) Transcript_20363:360-629(+)
MTNARGPQSVQSLPYTQLADCEFGPPSSHTLLLDVTQSSKQVVRVGEGGKIGGFGSVGGAPPLARRPQSSQSVPYEQSAVVELGPPSSQ